MKLKLVMLVLTLLLSSSLSAQAAKPIENINSEVMFAKTDLNMDRIADYSSAIAPGNMEVGKAVVVLKNTVMDISRFETIPGMRILNEYPEFSTVVVEGFFDSIARLSAFEEVLVIEEVQQFSSTLAYATEQVDIRPQVWDSGYRGDPTTTIAIMDTGIDDSHPFFQDRIVGWKDFIGASATSSNDLYSTPTDKNGHGTHVAGIAAGGGVSNLPYYLTVADTIPTAGDLYVVDTTTYQSSTHTIEITADWGVAGDVAENTALTFFAYKAPLGGSAQLEDQTITDKSGLDTVTLTLSPGEYYILVSATSPTSYEVSIRQYPDDHFPQRDNNDGYNTLEGAAPGAKILPLKVMDDEGNSDTLILLDALSWLQSNKDLYNVTVLNLSLGTSEIITSVDNAINNLVDTGVVVVVSAGNEGPDVSKIGSPGSAAKAITVGAVNRYNEVAYYSSKGSTTLNSPLKPDVVAPGGSYASDIYTNSQSGYNHGMGLIISADSNDRGYQTNTNGYIGLQGTSMASPLVAGIALLVIDKMKDLGIWDGTGASALKVKSAIIASTAEVANIGNNGGEYINGGTDPAPTIQRTGKDPYEGYGLVNAQAALNYFESSTPLDYPIALNFGFEDPFTPNSYNYYLEGGSGTEYQISLDVPSTADLDMLVYSQSPNSNGEPTILYSSTQGKGIDESLSFTLASSSPVILSVKVVDSDTIIASTNLTIKSNFIPSMSIISPVQDSYQTTHGLVAHFNSKTSFAKLYMNGTEKAFIENGVPVDFNLSDGYYNMTLVETNSLTSQSASDTVFINVDNTLPILTTNLTSGIVEDSFYINFSAADNIQIKSVEVLVDDEVADYVNGTSGALYVDISTFSFGNHTVSVVANDIAGNQNSTSQEISFQHEVYMEALEDMTMEARRVLGFEWNVGSNSPDHYEVFVNGTLEKSVTWDGAAVDIELAIDDVGYYEVMLKIFSENSSLARTVILQVVDTISPVISFTPPKTFDSNEMTTIQVIVSDFDPIYSIDFGPFAVGTPTVSSSVTDLETVIVTYTMQGSHGDVAKMTVTASDSSGNSVESIALYEWADQVAPSLSIPEDRTVERNEEITIVWSLTEANPESATILINGEKITDITDLTQGDVTFIYTFTTSGSYEVELTVVDIAGNSAGDIVVVTVPESSGFFSLDLPSPALVVVAVLVIPLVRKTPYFRRSFNNSK